MARVDKYKLGEVLALKLTSVKDLSHECGIHVKTLAKYKRLFKNSMRICEKTGRPPALDDEAMALLNDVMIRNPNISDNDIREQVRLHHRKTWDRWKSRHGQESQQSYRRIPRRTLLRYVEKLSSIRVIRKAQVADKLHTSSSVFESCSIM